MSPTDDRTILHDAQARLGDIARAKRSSGQVRRCETVMPVYDQARETWQGTRLLR